VSCVPFILPVFHSKIISFMHILNSAGDRRPESSDYIHVYAIPYCGPSKLTGMNFFVLNSNTIYFEIGFANRI
jgi:hypothetical protein